MRTGDAHVMRGMQEAYIGQIFSKSSGTCLARRLRQMLRLWDGIAGEVLLERVQDILQERLLQVGKLIVNYADRVKVSKTARPVYR